MNIYQISIRPRHQRFMFFIDSNYAYDQLYKLIIQNQSLWGGRYNPIIPVNAGIIAQGYLGIIEHYDPDVVFYSDAVDPEMLKKLRLFNPNGYVNMDVHPRIAEISGVNTFFFLTDYDSNAKVLLPDQVWPKENPMPPFYELNFGLSDTPYHHEYEMSKAHVQLKIDGEKFSELNKIIHHEKPLNLAALSRKNINTRVLRNLQHAQYDDFELIVARDSSSITDLLYYWNRGLYEHKQLMFVTVEQLNELSKDKFFGGVLYDAKGNDPIRVVSLSLNEAEIIEIIETKLRPIAFNSSFRYFDISSFPYKVLDGGGFHERDYGESTTTQTLVSDTGLIHIPKLSFGGTPRYLGQTFALDIRISEERGTQQNQVLFPMTTETMYIVKEVKGRVNLLKNLTVFINSRTNQSDVLQIVIPTFPNLLLQLIPRPIFQGERIENKIVTIGPHDDSNRLKAFIKAFNGELRTINDFFNDKFWVDMFEELCTSEKVAGDAISFAAILTKALEMYSSQKLELVDREKGWFNLDNLTLGLKRTLTELTAYQVFFKGFKLKCPNCSSIFWYSVNDVREMVTCKGCLQDFDLPIEPEFAYKLNDLIRNNIFKTKTTRDGNLTVIRTLAALSQGMGSFQYSPQLNLYDTVHNRKPFGDLDILVNHNGKLLIGEAKYHSAGFFEDNMKSLKSLAEVAKLCYPASIILACSVDENAKLEKACKSMKRLLKDWPYVPEIRPVLLRKPDYWHIKSYRYFVY